MKHYAFIMMLLVGLLIPMTIASKSADFNVNTILFEDQQVFDTVDVLKFAQPKKIKFIEMEEVAIQNIRFSENQIVLSIGQGKAMKSELICCDSLLYVYSSKTIANYI